MMPTTGPKLSSVITRIEWSTSTRICGAMYVVPAASRGKPAGSISARAPACTASAIWPRTKSAEAARAIGPRLVSASRVSPSRYRRVSSAAPSTNASYSPAWT